MIFGRGDDTIDIRDKTDLSLKHKLDFGIGWLFRALKLPYNYIFGGWNGVAITDRSFKKIKVLFTKEKVKGLV